LEDVERIVELHLARINKEGSGIKLTKMQRDIDIVNVAKDPN
jgi:hypothetical protein